MVQRGRNRTKSLFLANMSHELRTPLNAILGFSELIRRDATLHTAQREHLDIIRGSGTHLLDLIEDVLDMSKIEAGRVVLDERAFDLHPLLAGLEKPFALRASEQGVALAFTIAPRMPAADAAPQPSRRADAPGRAHCGAFHPA